MLEKLTISYQMQLSSTAQANKEINNNGTLDFGFGVSTKKVSVYTGSKQFVKIETNKPDKRLAGAVFLIKTKQEITSSKQPTDTSGQRTNQMRFT